MHPPPDFALVGERVIVRLGRPSDAPRLLAFFRDNDDFIARTQNRFRPELMREDSLIATLMVRRADYEADRSCSTFLFDRTSGTPLGYANLTNFVRGYFQACYLGYGLGEQSEGKGLMTEALRLLLPFAFERLALHRIMANHTPDNTRSAALLTRLGFRREGLAPRYLSIHDQWRDHVLTALHPEDFEPTKT
jgi:ribosomal-protein-alanine N-acetyltransferase